MKLTSPAFENNEEIPSEYTCDGPNVSPELRIEGVPGDSKSLVLITDDPDAPAGVWCHWVVFNMPPDLKIIEKGKEPEGRGGKSTYGATKYMGPCPPSGTHRYFFKLYALDTYLDLPPGSEKEEIEAQMAGHILETAELVGLYSRR